jgi:alpha-tubulin suppressor-like RCC1 family protein
LLYDWLYWGAEEGRGGEIGENEETPQFIEENIKDVSAGSRYTLLIDVNGDAYASGFIESKLVYAGHFGVDPSRLSTGSNVWKEIDVVVNPNGNEVSSPKFAKAYAGASATANSGDMHSVLIDEDGNLFTMGNNDRGQLCLGDRQKRYIPHKVNFDTNSQAVAAAVGEDFTLILLANGRVYGCGSNQKGELGLGSNVPSVDTPNNNNGLSSIVSISAGLNFALFQAENDEVYATGSNLYRQQCFFSEGAPMTTPKVQCS